MKKVLKCKRFYFCSLQSLSHSEVVIHKSTYLIIPSWMHRRTQGEGRGEWGKAQKNAIKHEKGDAPKFSDSPKYPPQNNLAKTPRPPTPGFSTNVYLCVDDRQVYFSIGWFKI
jgi:hypothetical protein